MEDQKSQGKEVEKMIKLTTEQCIKQLELYADANEELENSERAFGFRSSAQFLRDFHEDQKE